MVIGLTLFRKIVPLVVRQLLKRGYRAAHRFAMERILEPAELLAGLRNSLTPPRSKIYVGDGDFNTVGEEFRQYFIDLCALKPDAAVLKVGCGIGRIAVPLTRYLSAAGSYEGFDPVPGSIDWCQQYITPRFPNFRFQQVDIRNAFYCSGDQHGAISYRFSYADNQFDVVVIVTVFTHMAITEISNYLDEIKWVLKPGGRCFTSFFLLDDESRRLMSTPASTYNFQYLFEGRQAFDPQNPSTGSAHDEQQILDLFGEHGLSVDYPIYHGSWSGRQPALSFVDSIVVRKP